MNSERHPPLFFTATILEWKHLLKPEKYKKIIISSLDHLVKVNRVAIYGFVVMINHLHIIWQMKERGRKLEVQRDFLKFTAQRIKKDLQRNHPQVLERFLVNAADRHYQLWERNSLSVALHSEKMLLQKLNYIHENPVRAGLVKQATAYKYSSAAFYEGVNDWKFLQHYTGRV
jgi:putative transposase